MVSRTRFTDGFIIKLSQPLLTIVVNGGVACLFNEILELTHGYVLVLISRLHHPYMLRNNSMIYVTAPAGSDSISITPKLCTAAPQCNVCDVPT